MDDSRRTPNGMLCRSGAVAGQDESRVGPAKKRMPEFRERALQFAGDVDYLLHPCPRPEGRSLASETAEAFGEIGEIDLANDWVK